jgi:hypothetical protein
MGRTFMVIAILAPLLLLSCAKDEEVKEAAPSTAEIIDRYVDTLVNAPKATRKAVIELETRNEAEERALRELE